MKLIIEPRIQDIGFSVKRVLPSRHKQRVGPFIFFDHMGPARFSLDKTTDDVRPHPHIGLATVTYLFTGAMMHRDSLGSVQQIEPGAINLMTAGKGIVHSERIPQDIRQTGAPVEGIQTWLALPLEQEHCEPDFKHYEADSIPQIAGENFCARVLIGEALGAKSPVATASPTLYIDLQLDANSEFNLSFDAQEMAIYLAEGELSLNGEALPLAHLALVEQGDVLRASCDARVMIFGGDVLAGERYIFWNFVASQKDALRTAGERWERDEFPKVPGETERIPLPQY